jgi:TolB-like protein/Flp pilus assembly protein TadD
VNPKKFFAELKRRNVYKVAVAYAIVGWLVIQIAATVVPALHLSDAITTAVVLLVILGFPIALIFAWAFELTPEGIKRTEFADELPTKAPRSRAWIYVVIVAGAISVSLFFLGRYTSSKQNAELPAKSIAVLPFENLSGNPENAYFTDGIQEEILMRLAKIADLKVVSRTSTVRYKRSPENLREIATQLGVANVLEGSVQRTADRVHVNVQLIKAASDAHLWAEAYDRKLTDIFAVESEIAKTIAETLQAKLTGSERNAIASQPTENTEAHQLYLRGRYLWNRRTGENLKKALAYFEQAAEKDPTYALAYAGMADACILIPIYAAGTPQDYLPRARAAAQKAVGLDDTLAEAHNSLAAVFSYDFEFAQAAKEHERAISLNPNYATAHQWYGQVLAAVGEFDRALAEEKRALELDPVSPIISANLGVVCTRARRYDEAIAQLRETVEMHPEFYSAHRFLGWALELKGATSEAIGEYHKAFELSDDPVVLALLAHAEVSIGKQDEARQILAQLTEEAKARYVPAYAFAVIHLALGERDQALDWLEKAARDHDGFYSNFIKVDPYLDPLRGDPRFEALVSAILSGSVK